LAPDNAFGFDDEPDEPIDLQGGPDDPPFADVQASEPEPVSDPVEALEQDAAPVIPAEPGSEEEPSEPVEVAAEEAEAFESRYVGEGRKYADQSGLEQGYDNALSLAQRTAERLRQAEAEQLQMQQLLRQAASALQQPAQRGPAPLDPALLAQAREAGVDEDTLRLAQGLAASEAESRTQALRHQMLTEQQIGAEQAQVLAFQQGARSTIESFRAAHPDAAPGSALDTQVAAIVTDLQLDFTDGAMLETAYEAAKDEPLYRVLRANPIFTETDEGMHLARALAHPGTPAAAAPVPQRPASTATPHVEAGGSGLRPEAADAEEWSVLKLMRDEQKHASPLGI